MRIGSLDRRVTLMRPVQTGPTEHNETLTSWQDVATVWAGVAAQSEGERPEAGKATATRTVTFRIRWRGDVDERWRLLFDGRPWEIRGVREIGRRIALEITAESKI